jgi:histidinol-phosphate aminotransferase
MSDHQEHMTSLFNGYVAASVIHALDATGVLDALSARGEQSIEQLSSSLKITNQPSFLAVLNAAQWLGILRRSSDGTIALAAEDLPATCGFFTWLVGGYGDMMAQLPDLLADRRQLGVDVGRNESAVARGAGKVGASLIKPTFERALAPLVFDRVVDLGCGDGSRLIDLAKSRPNVRGVGVELSAAAARLAAINVERAGLSHRLEIIHGDALADDGARIECDLVMSFFLLHDFVNACGSTEAVMKAIGRKYSATRCLFADTVVGDRMSAPPLFSAAFELVHGLMRVPLYTRAQYEAGFRNSGVEIESIVPAGAPNSWLWILNDCQR